MENAVRLGAVQEVTIKAPKMLLDTFITALSTPVLMLEFKPDQIIT